MLHLPRNPAVLAMAFAAIFGGTLAGRAEDAESKKVALLVGINKYLKPGFPDLRYAEADVVAVGAELQGLGFDVTILLGSKLGVDQATLANIDAAARRIVAPLGKNDIALVMLSGHGQQLLADPKKVDIDQSRSYFCPVDARSNDPTTQFSLTYLLDEILARDVGRKIVLVDACRDVPADQRIDEPNAKGIEGRRIDLPEETAVYFSCRAGQKSLDVPALQHGLFTHCVLEALRGEAAGANGEISWSRLVAHVDDRMQQPEMLKYMGNFRQVPINAGAMPQTVLGRLAIPRSPPGSHDHELLVAPFTPEKALAARRATAATLDIAETISSQSIGLKFVLIPAGEFQMGGDQTPEEIVRIAAANGVAAKAQYLADEQPQHGERITQPFYLGVYEVTQREWETVMGSQPSRFAKTGNGQSIVAGLDTSTCPVETVSWYDSLDFCNKLSQRDGLPRYYTLTEVERTTDGAIRSATVALATRGASAAGPSGYRLPTEVEWEYACRAGTTTPFAFGKFSNGMQANHNGSSPYGTSTTGPYLQRTTSVGRYAANAFGLYDMHGNVWEWCFDAYDENGYGIRSGPTSITAVTIRGDVPRVHRGGSWADSATLIRSASRVGNMPVDRSNGGNGLRIARSL